MRPRPRLPLLPSVLAAALALAAPTSAQDGERYTYVQMKTSLGDMLFELDSHKAPITVENFLQYVDDGFYDDTIFHRVIDGFMIQGGGFTSAYNRQPTRDPIQNEADNGLLNHAGTIAMARTNDPHSASSQFFVNVVDNSFLNHKSRDAQGWGYCVFGKMIDGQATLDRIRTTPTAQNPQVGNMPAPITPVIIEKAERVDPQSCMAAIDRARTLEREERAVAVQAEEAQADVRQQLATLTEELGDAGLACAKVNGAAVEQGQKTESGLWYVDEVMGEGEPVKAGESVTVHYTGWLTDGTKFDSSHDRGQPVTFSLDQVIAGWGEGVTGMRPGGKRFLVIPYQLAYGEQGRPPTIPAKATLVFEIDLIPTSFDSHEVAMELLEGRGVDTSRGSFTDSGLWTLDVVDGSGPMPSSNSARVEVHYTGWLNDGTKFDSSRDRGQTITFGLNQVIKGWTEGVGGMKVGGRRYLVIPYAMAYGEGGRPPTIPPKATLVFDVELISLP